MGLIQGRLKHPLMVVYDAISEMFYPKHILLVITVLTSLVVVGCGTDPDVIATRTTEELPISRQDAIDRAIRYFSEQPGLIREPGPSAVTNITDITARFMSLAEFSAIQGIGAGYAELGEAPNGPVWVVQITGDSTQRVRDRSSGELELRTYRYATVALQAYSGGEAGSARYQAQPTFYSAEINEPGMNELVPVADQTISTRITREQVRQIAEENFNGSNSAMLDRMEIELIENPTGGIAWWVYVPVELGSSCGGTGGPDTGDGRHLWCFSSATWDFVNAENGEVTDGAYFGQSFFRVTNEEVQALHRFAWAEGWWELWHRLKPYEGQILPEGFAADLDRPNAPTPTPRPPTPTPDPNAPPAPTPTPAPTAT